MDLYNKAVFHAILESIIGKSVLDKGSTSRHCHQHEWRGLEAETARQDHNFKLYAVFFPQRPIPILPINGTELNPTKKRGSFKLLQ